MNKIKENLAVYLPRLGTWALSGSGQGEIETVARRVSEWSRRLGSSTTYLLAEHRRKVEKHRFSEDGEQYLLD